MVELNMCSSLIVPLLVLRLAASLSAADADGMPSMALVPHKQREEETEAGRHHRLAKRQSTCIYFFLFEPPGSLQCNPQVDNTLTLGCNFLVGRVSTSMSLRIGWFFSRDGVVGERQQVSQFQVLRPFVAFESVLVVLNALPGAYFCSVGINGQNQIFDSRALRVNATTLQDVCLPQEPPTLQPPLPFRCAQQLPVNRNDRNDLLMPIATSTTNTITLGITVPNPTPSYTFTVVEQFERTIPPPLVIATPLLQTEPATPLDQTESTNQTEPVPVNSNLVGIGIGVGVGVAILLVMLVTALIVGVVCFVRKGNSPHTSKRRHTFMNRFCTQQIGLNTEPLIGRPPDRPPPVLLQEPATPDPQGPEQFEMAQYTAPQVQPMPQPYEKVGASMPRYSKEPVKPRLSYSATEHATIPDIEQEAPQYTNPETEDILDGDHTYYSRPKFFTKDRGFSTSTHIYGECSQSQSTASSSYITPNQLEPFFSQDSQLVSENELMLASAQESTGYTSSDFLPSDSDEGSYTDEATDEDAGSTRPQAPTEHSLDKPDSWVGKSPATGQIGNSQEQSYVNARQYALHLTGEGKEAQGTTEYHASYVNTPHTRSGVPPNAGDITQISIKSAPNIRTKKKKKKMKRNRSTPSHGQQREEDTYTGLVHETSNYISVYASTLAKRAESNKTDTQN